MPTGFIAATLESLDKLVAVISLQRGAFEMKTKPNRLAVYQSGQSCLATVQQTLYF